MRIISRNTLHFRPWNTIYAAQYHGIRFVNQNATWRNTLANIEVATVPRMPQLMQREHEFKAQFI